MTAPLAEWLVHEVVIDRFIGRGPVEGDDEYDLASGSTAGFVQDGLKVVGNSNGEQVISTARVLLPAGTDYVPVNSRVTLPPQFGNRVTKVIACIVADGGGLPTPDHVQLVLGGF